MPQLIVFVTLLPLVFWGAYHYYKDRARPEPVRNLLICLGAGIVAAFLGRVLYLALDEIGLRYDAFELAETNRLALLGYAIAGIGFIEEFAKVLVFLLLVPRFTEFDEALDGIIYASFIALGFATVENVHYLGYLDLQSSVARAFASPMVHILFASIWAYYTGCALLDGRHAGLVAAASLVIAVLLHGIYDFLVIAERASYGPAAALLILVVWLWRMQLIRNLQRAAAAARD